MNYNTYTLLLPKSIFPNIHFPEYDSLKFFPPNFYFSVMMYIFILNNVLLLKNMSRQNLNSMIRIDCYLI